MRGNIKPFGKQLSPCAEITNHSGNDFPHARKSQTIREMTLVMRGNHKPFGKLFAGGPQIILFSQIDEINNNWNQIRTN